MAKKYVDRQEMDFVHFSANTEHIQQIYILPSRTSVAVAEELGNHSSQIIRIYNIKKPDEPTNIKIFPDTERNGVVSDIAFSISEPKFMCCLLSEPANRLIYIDTHKNKSLAESNFALKDLEKITISPTNSHLICATGHTTLKLFKIE